MNILLEIPQGQTKDDMEIRKKFIKNFYVKWNISNPNKQIYNTDLNDYINIQFLSIQETSLLAALSYKSTLAVTFLTEILGNAVVEKRVTPKTNNQNQKRFSEIILMKYDKTGFREIKLTIGVLKGSMQKIQYCITAIENG